MVESKRNIPIDLDRIDSHVIADHEYKQIPELTDEDFDRGTWSPPPLTPLTIDADVLARFRATGPGWEDRINQILRDAAASMDAA